MKLVPYLLLGSLCLCLAATQTQAADLVLVADGQPRAEIVAAKERPRMVTLAALELQHFLRKMSGASQRRRLQRRQWHRVARYADAQRLLPGDQSRRSHRRGQPRQELAEVKTERGNDSWLVRVCIPVVGASEAESDPRLRVAGSQPTESEPWHFNVGRCHALDFKKPELQSVFNHPSRLALAGEVRSADNEVIQAKDNYPAAESVAVPQKTMCHFQP